MDSKPDAHSVSAERESLGSRRTPCRFRKALEYKKRAVSNDEACSEAEDRYARRRTWTVHLTALSKATLCPDLGGRCEMYSDSWAPGVMMNLTFCMMGTW